MIETEAAAYGDEVISGKGVKERNCNKQEVDTGRRDKSGVDEPTTDH